MIHRWSILAALLAGTLAFAACSEEKEETPDAGVTEQPDAAAPVVPQCDPSKCAPGNICVENRCQLLCERHFDCPQGYDCRIVEGAGVAVCKKNDLNYGPGHFGTGCGLNGDADCAAADNFLCLGAIGDPDAYCTLKGCANDADCPGDYFCAWYDEAYKQPGRMCRKRGYCAPANSLLDCYARDAVFGIDTQARGFCLRSCSGIDPNGCGMGNECVKKGEKYECWPREGTCFPAPAFCTRCTSSLDCPQNGGCFYNPFTKERFCSEPCTLTERCQHLTPGGYQPICTDTDSDYGLQCIPDPPSQDDPFSCWNVIPTAP